MTSLLTIVLLLVVAALTAGLAWFAWPKYQKSSLRRRTDAMDTVNSWSPQGTRLLSVPERDAYALLCQALPEYLVFAQVPLARFIKVPTRSSYGEWLRRIGSHCADLLVTDAQSRVVAVIELRKPVQESDRARRRHDRLTRVLKAAEVELLTWEEDALPSQREVVAMFASRIEAALPVAANDPPVLNDIPIPTSQRAAPANAPVYAAKTVTPSLTSEAPPSTWFDDLEEGGPDTVAFATQH